jgi:hypothetical protein
MPSKIVCREPVSDAENRHQHPYTLPDPQVVRAIYPHEIK